MNPHELQQYLHTHILLSRAMGVEVVRATPDGVELAAPLAPNINHRATVFGGSASALAILAAWSLLHLRQRIEGLDCRLVIQRNSVEYVRPIAGPFTATAAIADAAAWAAFVRAYRRRGRARIALAATLQAGGEQAGAFTGEFAALRPG